VLWQMHDAGSKYQASARGSKPAKQAVLYHV
jgi:hypothetical protein